jgi:hypothetical protein
MSERGNQLSETAGRQIRELSYLLSLGSETSFSLPCSGREKLGDGTVGALAWHTADSYPRIAAFLQAINEADPARPGHPPVPRLDLADSHGPDRHADSAHDVATHVRDYTAAGQSVSGLLERLSATGDALSLLADLTDEQLETVPTAGSFKFCDGQRALEQVLSSLLKHQGHQIDAIRSALT